MILALALKKKWLVGKRWLESDDRRFTLRINALYRVILPLSSFPASEGFILQSDLMTVFLREVGQVLEGTSGVFNMLNKCTFTSRYHKEKCLIKQTE